MTVEEIGEHNERIRERILNCPAGFDDATPIGNGTFERCNQCGGIFWHERYDGRTKR